MKGSKPLSLVNHVRRQLSKHAVAWIAKLPENPQRIPEGQIPDHQQTILIQAPGVLQDLRPMRPALFVRKLFFYRRPKLIVPLGGDEAVPSQRAVELIQFVDGIGAGGLGVKSSLLS